MTRWYFDPANEPDVSPAFHSSWEETANAVRRTLILTKTDTACTPVFVDELYGSNGPGTPLSFVDQTTRKRTSNATSDTFTLPWTPAADEGLCLLFHVSHVTQPSVTSITGCGATWTFVCRVTRGTTHAAEIWIADRCDGASNSVTVNVSASSSGWGYNLSRWQLGPGEHLIAADSSTGNNNVTPVDAGTVDALAGDVVIGCAHGDSNTQVVSVNPTTPDFTTMTTFDCAIDLPTRQAYKLIRPVNPNGTPQTASGAMPFNLALPPERAVGDRLIIGVTHADASALTTPTGWTKTGDPFIDPCHATMFTRVCDGTETTVSISGTVNAGAASMSYAGASAGASNTGTATGTGVTFAQPTVAVSAQDRVVHVSAAQKGTTGADTIVMGTDVTKRAEKTDTGTRRVALGDFLATSGGTSPTETASGASFNPNRWAGITLALSDDGGTSQQPLAWSMSGTHTWVAAMATLRSTAGVRDYLHRQYVSDPLPAQTIPAGTRFQAEVTVGQGGTPQEHRAQAVFRVFSEDGLTERAVIYQDDAYPTLANSEWEADLNARFFPDISATGPVFGYVSVDDIELEEGDRIVVELGARNVWVNGPFSTIRMWWGDPADDDLATGSHFVSSLEAETNAPWFEIGADMTPPVVEPPAPVEPGIVYSPHRPRRERRTSVYVVT